MGHFSAGSEARIGNSLCRLCLNSLWNLTGIIQLMQVTISTMNRAHNKVDISLFRAINYKIYMYCCLFQSPGHKEQEQRYVQNERRQIEARLSQCPLRLGLTVKGSKWCPGCAATPSSCCFHLNVTAAIMNAFIQTLLDWIHASGKSFNTRSAFTHLTLVFAESHFNPHRNCCSKQRCVRIELADLKEYILIVE